MKIKDIMTTNIHSIKKGTSVYGAANIMKKYDIGFLPILEDENVVGVITDRDIVVKCLTNNSKLYTPVCKYKTDKVIIASINDSLEHAMFIMGANKVTRLLVLDEMNSLKGIISLFDIHKYTDDSVCNIEINKIKNTEKKYNINSSVSDFSL